MNSTAKYVGIVLTVIVALWDIDAMRPHIAAHSWLTLGYVSIFLVGHMVDALSLGSITYSGALSALYGE